ncbi:MAG: PhnD/SsuA/transferrin family substrate-binding protein [Desulfuromusa sp.]|nr:PhnD/SsuA/transferrin family substrate-binding protein [Desulfuromusa sp.]
MAMSPVETCQSGSSLSQFQPNLLLRLFFCWFVFFVTSSPISANNLPVASVKIGVLAKRGQERALEKWGPTAGYLSQMIPGQRFEIVPLDFEGIRLAAMSQSVNFLITNSSYYVSLESDHGLSRIATMTNLHGDVQQNVFGGVIITRADRDDIDSLKDLVGKSFWAVDRKSLGGWLAAWREFHAQDIKPEHDFGLLKYSGTHDAVVLAVLNGETDAGTVRTDTLERMAAEGKINLSDFKILNSQTGNIEFEYLLSTRLYPEWPFATLPHTPQKLAQDVAAALLSMSAASQAAQAANIGGWTVPFDYQPIYDLLKELHLCLYKKYVSEISLTDFLREYWLSVVLLILLLGLLCFVTGYTILLNRKLDQRVEERTRELLQEVAERKLTEEKLHRAEKMEAIGLMASGVAHDLNNILSGVVSYPELLLMRLPADSELRQPITIIKDSGLRAAAVVADLLTVARDAAKVRSRENINTLILEYLQSPEAEKVRSLFPGISITSHLAADIKLVCCSPTHVNKSIMNLVLNAAEAVDVSGRIDVCTKVRELSTAQATDIGVTAGSYVVLTISDNGSGIDAADQKHIFEPFYTKKKMGRSGTGIGLAVVWNCMQDHGGTVTVQSNEMGTTFTLFFPLDDEDCNQLIKREATGIDSQLMAHGERILVVDDEVQQRDIATQILEELGYEVQVVSSGEDAIEYVKTDQVDLLFLDMVMEPGIDGLQTYAEIRKIHPGQKALLVSGFSESKKVEKAFSLGVGGFLKKPYTIEQLAASVREILSN